MGQIKIGAIAPSFNLLNQDNEKISLKEILKKKNVVLYFYPRAMTPGCTTEACDFTNFNDEFSSRKTVILGISPDEPERLKKFQEKYNINFDLLSDVDHKIAEKYGVWQKKKLYGKEFLGIVRTTFIINKSGKITQLFEKVKVKNHAANVLESLDNL